MGIALISNRLVSELPPTHRTHRMPLQSRSAVTCLAGHARSGSASPGDGLLSTDAAIVNDHPKPTVFHGESGTPVAAQQNLTVDHQLVHAKSTRHLIIRVLVRLQLALS